MGRDFCGLLDMSSSTAAVDHVRTLKLRSSSESESSSRRRLVVMVWNWNMVGVMSEPLKYASDTSERREHANANKAAVKWLQRRTDGVQTAGNARSSD
jgi:hypothetical protein